MTLWPWWLGALALAAVSLGYAFFVRRPLGVSGLISTALSREKDDDLDDAALIAALAEATRAQFGEVKQEAPSSVPIAARLGWGSSVLFLVGIAGGGFLSMVLSGTLSITSMPTGVYAHFFDGALAFVALFVGGILVGAGTTLAGGCTSGHGLVGCARMQPGSLAATASFFGTAIAVSFALAVLLGGAP
jgi:uncharacterized protein